MPGLSKGRRELILTCLHVAPFSSSLPITDPCLHNHTFADGSVMWEPTSPKSSFHSAVLQEAPPSAELLIKSFPRHAYRMHSLWPGITSQQHASLWQAVTQEGPRARAQAHIVSAHSVGQTPAPHTDQSPLRSECDSGDSTFIV